MHVISDNIRKIPHKLEKNNSKSKNKIISNQLSKNSHEVLFNDINVSTGNIKVNSYSKHVWEKKENKIQVNVN